MTAKFTNFNSTGDVTDSRTVECDQIIGNTRLGFSRVDAIGSGRIIYYSCAGMGGRLEVEAI